VATPTAKGDQGHQGHQRMGPAAGNILQEAKVLVALLIPCPPDPFISLQPFNTVTMIGLKFASLFGLAIIFALSVTVEAAAATSSAEDKKHHGARGLANEGNMKVAICHIPPDDPSNFHTIMFSENDKAAHMAHGDLEGSCNENCMTLCPCLEAEANDCEEVRCSTCNPSASPSDVPSKLPSESPSESPSENPSESSDENPKCEEASCGSFVPCEEQAGSCTFADPGYCFAISNDGLTVSGGICARSTSFAPLQNCYDGVCPPDSVCSINTCCGVPICYPSIYFCSSNSGRNLEQDYELEWEGPTTAHL
jgi:hypothetical protein